MSKKKKATSQRCPICGKSIFPKDEETCIFMKGPDGKRKHVCAHHEGVAVEVEKQKEA